MKKVLFLCSGNYYRSRIAEEYFNYLSTINNSDYTAYSKALRQDLGNTGNVGFIAKEAIEILEAINVEIKSKQRMPESVNYSDFEQADIVIAMDETEHKPMMEKFFPLYKNKVVYFNVGDVHVEPIYVAVVKLIKTLDKFILDLV